ncbi:potassium channel family protein [Magnetococcus sp. PR-3]|uniref:potassium channel family protein n=1 Tax=Magnetococcus sp. PR-3 TaxID=3120355 RepID=UPI002FCE1030
MVFSQIMQRLRHLGQQGDSWLMVISTLGGITAMMVILCAPFMFWAESSHSAANVKSMGDAAWLSFMIVTTIGFGDFYPVTLVGRLLAIPLAATGIGVFGALAGYFGSMLLDRVVRAATTDMLHDQNQRIEQLVSMNRDLNHAIQEVSVENQDLNRKIVAISEQNEQLNRKIEEDTNEILEVLKEMRQEKSN